MVLDLDDGFNVGQYVRIFYRPEDFPQCKFSGMGRIERKTLTIHKIKIYYVKITLIIDIVDLNWKVGDIVVLRPEWIRNV